MQKVKIEASNHTSTAKPVAAYVVRLEKSNDALFARYFKVTERQESEEYIPIKEALESFDPTSTALMSQRVTERNFIKASAVTGDVRVKDAVLSEIGRHIFRPTIGAGTVCGAGERNDFAAFVLPFGSDGAVSEPYNHFTESGEVKGVVPRNGRLRGAQPIFILYSDVATANLDNWTLIYIDSIPFVFEDATGGEWQSAPTGFNLYSLLPTVSVQTSETIAADGATTVAVELSRDGAKLNYSGELVVEPVSGYVPKRRLTIANGSGAFKVMALGLEASDTLRVKVGTRNISGLADASIKVT